jgi:hypothetical protein
LRCNPVTRRICGAPKANGGYVAMGSPSCTSVMGCLRVYTSGSFTVVQFKPVQQLLMVFSIVPKASNTFEQTGRSNID